MSLIKCKYCNKEISDKAISCPYCKKQLNIKPTELDIESSKSILVPVTCPKCHATLNLDSSLKKAFCNYCGTEVLIKNTEAKVTINKNDDKEKYRILMHTSEEGKNYSETEKYATNILEIDPCDIDALYYKGLSIIKLSTRENTRLDEAVVYLNKCVSLADKENKLTRMEYKNNLYKALKTLYDKSYQNKISEETHLIFTTNKLISLFNKIIILSDEYEDYNFYDYLNRQCIKSTYPIPLVSSIESIYRASSTFTSVLLNKYPYMLKTKEKTIILFLSTYPSKINKYLEEKKEKREELVTRLQEEADKKKEAEEKIKEITKELEDSKVKNRNELLKLQENYMNIVLYEYDELEKIRKIIDEVDYLINLVDEIK